jgi:hypothetical protein
MLLDSDEGGLMMFESEEIHAQDTTKDNPSRQGGVPPLATALRLWSHIFAEQRGYLALFTARRKGSTQSLVDPETTYYSWPEEAGKAVRYALDDARRGREVYFCANLLTEKRRVKAAAAPVMALWADGDGAKVPPHLPQPTAVVESSPGREHFYWRLTQPIAPEQAEALNKRLAYAIGADKSGWDLGQLLRVPGTPNFKYPDHPVVTISEIREKEMRDAS